MGVVLHIGVPLRCSTLGALFLAAWLLFPVSLAAQRDDELRRVMEGVGIEEKLGARLPADTPFLDEKGAEVTFGECVGKGKPVLLTVNYFDCVKLCQPQLEFIIGAMREMAWVPGREYDVITLSINPDDAKPRRAAVAKSEFMAVLGKPEAETGWHFLVSQDEKAIRAITNAAGFNYKQDPKTGEFLHQAAVIFLTPDGRISSYKYGLDYSAANVSKALEDAKAGKILTSDEQAALRVQAVTCLNFEPTDNMKLWMNVMRIGGIAVMLALGTLVAVYWVREAKKKQSGVAIARPVATTETTP